MKRSFGTAVLPALKQSIAQRVFFRLACAEEVETPVRCRDWGSACSKKPRKMFVAESNGTGRTAAQKCVAKARLGKEKKNAAKRKKAVCVQLLLNYYKNA